MVGTTYKKPLDISEKDGILNKEESVKIPRNVVIDILKMLKGFERKLQKELK